MPVPFYASVRIFGLAREHNALAPIKGGMVSNWGTSPRASVEGAPGHSQDPSECFGVLIGISFSGLGGIGVDLAARLAHAQRDSRKKALPVTSVQYEYSGLLSSLNIW